MRATDHGLLDPVPGRLSVSLAIEYLMTPSLAALKTIIERCGIRLEARQYEQLWHYHRLLREANRELNLTRIHNFENMVLKHYVDCLLVLKFGGLPSPLMDLGSGPGLPGIVLKIARPQTQMILAETRSIRCEFLARTCELLGLGDVEVQSGRISPRFRQPVRGVITRAVAEIPATLDLVSGCLERGGKVLFMKGPDCDDEIARTRSSHAGVYKLLADHHYAIPGTTHNRRLVVYERLVEPAPIEGVEPEGDEDSEAGASTPRISVREVTSPSNAVYRQLEDVLTGKGIRKQGKALIAGTKLVDETLERYRDRVEAWVTPSAGPPPPVAGIAWYRLSDALFRTIDVSGTHAPLLLVEAPTPRGFDPAEPWPAGCTLFVGFQDPENVGAVIRSAVAFGVTRIVLLKEASHPLHPKAIRAAGTAVLAADLLAGPSIRELSTGDVPLLTLSTGGSDLARSAWPEAFGLLPGLEGPGLPEALRSDPTWARRIPIAAEVESLNAATATAIALYAWRTATSDGADA